MPIYEFKCLNCRECMEVLVMGTEEDPVTMQCKNCNGREFERIISSTGYMMAAGGDSKSQASTQNRTCSSGSCTTWNLPGHSE